MKQYLIEPIEDKDLHDICEIHKKTFSKEHFTVNFNQDLLVEYFHHLTTLNKYCFKCKIDNKVAGYLIGGKNIKEALSIFTSNHLIDITIALLKHPSFFLEKAGELINSKWGKKPSVIHNRLFLIGVNPEYQNQGVGMILINNFEAELMKNNIFVYGLSVRVANQNAISFYLNKGFIEEFRDKKAIYFKKNLTKKSGFH